MQVIPENGLESLRGLTGAPDFIWSPKGAMRASFCLEVKTPWKLPTWEKRTPLDPPYDETLDIVNLVAAQKYGPLENSIEQMSGYMLVSVMSTHIVV